MQITTRRLAASRTFAIAALAGAALLTLAACGSSSDNQPQAQSQPQARQTVDAEQPQTQPPDADRSSQSQQQERERQEPQEQPADQVEQSVEDEPGAAAQPDDDAGEAQSVAAAAIIEPAAYEDLNPRLQLLRDSGYPVYISDEYIIALGTPDLSPGVHRISVVIEGPAGLIEFPAISVIALPEAAPDDAQEVIARFARFPDGVRGLHVTAVDFTRPGRWHVILRIPSEDGFADVGLALDIPEDTSAPSVGDSAPASLSRTLLDVDNIADLSTGETPDPGLYLISVAEALQAGKPFVVVFASPGFCTNAFCGPQAEVLSEVRQRFGDAASYIHIDLYENPEQVRLGEEPIETPILEEWGLHTDEWTFVVGADGVVSARFEAFAPLAEVEAALAAILEG